MSSPAAPERPVRKSRVRAVVEGVLFVIGIPTAVVTFITFIPTAWQATHYRSTEYALLRTIHAGDSDDHLRAKLGEPTQAHALGGGTGLTEQVFVRDEYTVAAVEDADGQAITLSVFACVDAFRPSFSTPRRTSVTLNSDPLASAEKRDADSTEKGEDVNARLLIYSGSGAGSSSDMITEPSEVSGTGYTGYRSYALGVSPACGAESTVADPDQPGALAYSSDGGGAVPQAITRFRETHAPNVYLESIDPDLRVEDDGCLRFSQHAPTPDVTYTCALATASWTSLPRDYRTPHPIAWYRNLWGG